MTASLLQPVVGLYTDKRPMPYSLAIGMGFTLAGLLLIAIAPTFGDGAGGGGAGRDGIERVSSGIVAGGAHGFGRAARAGAIVVSGGRKRGTALGPLLAAYIVLPQGQKSIGWFSVVALVAMAMLARIGAWYKAHRKAYGRGRNARRAPDISKRSAVIALTVLIALVFSKFFYMVSLTTYYEFYLMSKFQSAGARRADRPVHFPGRGRAGDHHRRTDRRPHRAQARHLVVDSGRRCRSRCCCLTRACSGPSA